jgi:hypothetical protein
VSRWIQVLRASISFEDALAKSPQERKLTNSPNYKKITVPVGSARLSNIIRTSTYVLIIPERAASIVFT